MSKNIYEDKDFLVFLYWTQEYSLRDLARLSGYSQQGILKRFRKLGIPTRTKIESLRTKRAMAKVSKPRKKMPLTTEEHRKSSGEGVKKIRARKRREEKYFHRENILVIEEI